MKEHPILFSTPMVQAILEGRKTQTRRVIKSKPKNLTPEGFSLRTPYGKPGDWLWVRETFTPALTPDFLYKADGTRLIRGQWKPSIHMPKAAARIWLQVEEIRIELLQDISEEDAIAEGVKALTNMHPALNSFAKTKGPNYRTGFAKIWFDINGEQSWNANPFVWVIKFKVLSSCGRPDTATCIQQPETILP